MNSRHLIGLLVSLTFAILSHAQTSPWTWVCENKMCLRKLKSEVNSTMTGQPMEICKLICDDMGSLWPKPTGQSTIGKGLVSICPGSIRFVNIASNPTPIRPMLTESSTIFNGYIAKLHPPSWTCSAPNNALNISITVSEGTTGIGWDTNESYNLTLQVSNVDNNSTVSASISAVTFFGARHALETLSQLIAYNSDLTALQVVSTGSIVDAPVFKYRGIMLDTSRNYFGLDHLRKLIDGMSYNKLNMFHWHITDSHSFPLEVQSWPKMLEYGAYTPAKVYRKNDIINLVSYAKQRGVKIIPELDQPAHSGHGYQWGAIDGLGDLVVCVESEPWYNFCVEPPCGQLNIINDNVTQVVGDIIKDMLTMFDNDVFHLGGDEVDFRCYNSSQAIREWMLAQGWSLDDDGFFKLWGGFQDALLAKLEEYSAQKNHTQVIMWTSTLTYPERIEEFLDKSKYVIQIWSESTDEKIGGIMEKGYRTIFSNVNALYLDCGFPAWLGTGHNWCAPVKGWQVVYDNDPEKIYANFTNETVAAEAVRSGQILGSETPLWTEQADGNSLQTRIWPRAAAHAERLWTHPKTSYAEAETRMVTNRNRMSARGIFGDRLQPEFCLQFEGKCYPEPKVDPTDPPTTTSTTSSTTTSTTTTTTTTSTASPTTSTTTTSTTTQGTDPADHITVSFIVTLTCVVASVCRFFV